MSRGITTAAKSATTRPLLFDRFAVGEGRLDSPQNRLLHAFDTQTETHVALKVLPHVEADALLRFKRDFRTLSDLHHPHLAELYELFEIEGQWGYSMEWIEGVDFVTYVRDEEQGTYDEPKLRDALTQLAHGLFSLHAAGFRHRDLKRSNVIVTKEGRVVLVDFALFAHTSVEELSARGDHTTLGARAPELLWSGPENAASDFYALGALLFEALCGAPPFRGAYAEVLEQKRRGVWPCVENRAPKAPRDLAELSNALLSPDPNARPGSERIAAVLQTNRSGPLTPPQPKESFVGRKRELQSLREALRGSQKGRFSLVLIEGESGVGKSALARRFAAQVEREEPGALVLRGRCHPTEQVPFKAFDGVVDDLSAFLTSIDPQLCAALLPRSAGRLAPLFPVLERIPPVKTAYLLSEERGEPVARHQMFAAFVELLERLGEKRRLVLIIDDLQWSDAESLRLLQALLDPVVGPSVLCLATVRPLSALSGEHGEALRELLSSPCASVLSLSGLASDDALVLSARLLAKDPRDESARRLAEAAKGHPLFMAELCARKGMGEELTAPDLDQAIRARARDMSFAARSVLELLCVSGAPTSTRLLKTALGLEANELARALYELRLSRFVKPERGGELSVYHDRARESLLSGLSENERALHHQRLAQALEDLGSDEAARIAQHWLRANEHGRAAPWVERTAREAFEKAAFERAAEAFEVLLKLPSQDADSGRAHALRLLWSESLASAGRCAESARVLLSALDGAPRAEQGELEERAAQRLLQAGAVDEGIAITCRAIRAEGLAWPSSTAVAVMRLIWHRAVISYRALTPRHDPDPKLRRQLDTLWRLSPPLGWVDLLRTAELGARHLSLALRSGDPNHVGFALCAEAVFVCMQTPNSEKVDSVLLRASEWVDRSGSDELRAYFLMARGQIRFFRGDIKGARSDFDEAELLYRTRCPGQPWFLANCRGFALQTCLPLGDLGQIKQLGASWLSEARERGDKFAIASLVVLGGGFARHLLDDNPKAALAEVASAMAPWRSTGFGVQHLGELVALSTIYTYEGGLAAERFWQETWPKIASSFLIKARFVAEMMRGLRASAVVAATVEGKAEERAFRLREARALLRPLDDSGSQLARIQYTFLLAQVCTLEGKFDEARELAQATRTRCADVGYVSDAASEVLLAWLSDPEEGRRSQARLIEKLKQNGWKHPDRGFRWILPIAPLLPEIVAQARPPR